MVVLKTALFFNTPSSAHCWKFKYRFFGRNWPNAQNKKWGSVNLQKENIFCKKFEKKHYLKKSEGDKLYAPVKIRKMRFLGTLKITTPLSVSRWDSSASGRLGSCFLVPFASSSILNFGMLSFTPLIFLFHYLSLCFCWLCSSLSDLLLPYFRNTELPFSSLSSFWSQLAVRQDFARSGAPQSHLIS